MAKTKRDRSAELGLGGTATGAGVAGGTVYTLAGGSASASAITYALATIGGYFGGGMAAGLAAVIGGPLALGVGGYALGKALTNGNIWPFNNSNKNNRTSYPKSKNLDKKRQPLVQICKKEYMMHKAIDIASDYLTSSRPKDPETSRSETIYRTFLNPKYHLLNTLSNSSAKFFSKRIEGLLKEIQDSTLSNKDRDRLLFLTSWLTLMYYLTHFCDVNCAGEEDEMYELLDLIDSYVAAMSYRTPEALYLYYVANMFSADRIENSIPSVKLKEFRHKLSQIQLNENETEFKPCAWEGINDTVYNIMKRIIS